MKKIEIIFKIIISISLISIVFILSYFLIFNKNNSDNKIEGNIPKDSINNNIEISLIESKLNAYIKLLNNKNTDLNNYYSANLDYYDKSILTKDSVLKDKKSFFKKWDNIKIEITNIQITKDSTGYNCIFDKSFDLKSKDNSFYKGKVKSNIKFANIENDWKIISEKDDEIYSTEKSKSLKEFIEEFKKEVPKSKDYFLDHVESPLITVVLEEVEKRDASYWYESIKSAVKSKHQIKGNSVIFNEITYEYSVTGSELPHEFYFRKDNNGVWKLYKIKWAGC